MKIFPFFESATRLIVYIPAVTVSGLLYFWVLRALKTTKAVGRKKAIARAFIVLWASWVLCTIPYLVIEFYILNFVSFNGYGYAAPEDLSEYFAKDFWNFQLPENSKTIIVVEISLRIVRQCFGFVDSVLLIVLLRPFQEPIIQLVSKVKQKTLAK